MQERRNAVLAVVLLIGVAWAVVAWVVAPEVSLWLPGLVWHRIGSVLVSAAMIIYLFFALSAPPPPRRAER